MSRGEIGGCREEEELWFLYEHDRWSRVVIVVVMQPHVGRGDRYCNIGRLHASLMSFAFHARLIVECYVVSRSHWLPLLSAGGPGGEPVKGKSVSSKLETREDGRRIQLSWNC